MPRLRVDSQEVEVAPGTTLLGAAAKVGVRIPTLCWRQGYDCSTSCMVCAVKVVGRERLLPACAAPAEEGMEVVTGDEDVRRHRREVLDLLLSDHTGDCEGPCRLGCPAHLDIPNLLRGIQRGDWQGAAVLARETLVLPETLGLICPAPCEKTCRRVHHDAAVSIRALHRTAAWRERHDDVTRARPATASGGLPVTIVGAGPTGLAAAAALARSGQRCVVLDERSEAGGQLHRAIDDGRLPAAVLRAEVDAVAALGVELRPGVRLGSPADLEQQRAESAAVLLAMGSGSAAAELGLAMAGPGVRVDRETSLTSAPGVFAAGGVVREIRQMAVRAVAAGKAAAAHIDAWLRGSGFSTHHEPVHVRLGHLREGELAQFLAGASPAPRVADTDAEALGNEAACAEAARCLHCDCRAARTCALRTLAAEFGASPHRWRDTRRSLVMDASHPDVIYEPGKCIACGLCIQAAERARERYGTAFLWRGISVRIGPPLGETLAAALTASAEECVAVCPTGALAWKRD